MAKPARKEALPEAAEGDATPPEPTPLPPLVLLVARGRTPAGEECVAALETRGTKLLRTVVLETAQAPATADRAWREWAWRLLRMGESLPEPQGDTVTWARAYGLAKGGRAWGVLRVCVDAEGLTPEVLSTADTKAEAWDDLERHAAHHLLDDERRRHLLTNGKWAKK